MYNYKEERPKVFLEENQRIFLKIRDKIDKAMDSTGAITVEKAIMGIGGDTFLQLACIDRLIELGEIKYASQEGVGQDWVIVSA